MEETRWWLGRHGEDDAVIANHWCSNSDEVSDEGAIGGCFLTCVVVAGRDRGGYGVGWCGRERRRKLRLGFSLCEGERE